MLIALRPALPMIRQMATVIAGVLLLTAWASLEAPARAQPATSTDATAPLQPAPTSAPPRKERRRAERPIPPGAVVHGPDMIGLVAQLPWWRIDASQQPSSPDSGEFESPILTACDVWLGFPYATADANSLTVRLSAAQRASEIDSALDRIRVADPGELNEIDLTAPAEAPPAMKWGWLNGLLAIVGGAAAALSAARYLMV